MKKKTQAEIEQEMAALQYTNPMLLEVGTVLWMDLHSVNSQRAVRRGLWPTTLSSCHTCSGLISVFLVLGAANEDGPNEPDELRWEHGPPTGTGLYALLLWAWRSWGLSTSWPAGISSKHATSADGQQHGASHGPRQHAGSFHAPWTDGASLWTPGSPGAPSGHDGTTRHARTTKHAETLWPSQKYGGPRASWYGNERNAGAPWWDDGSPS